MKFEQVSKEGIKPEGEIQNENAAEKEKELGIDFFVTDHNLRYEDRATPERQRALYAEMKERGISSFRFDIDWKEIMPEDGAGSQKEIANRYAEAMKLMKEEGLEPPTIVISNPPSWAEQLYKSGDKEGYFRAFQEYLSSVAEVMKASGTHVHSAQLFNEVNHANLFHFADTEDLPKLARMVRTTLGEVQPDIKVSTSIIAANFSDNIPGDMRATDRPPLREFLSQYEGVLKEFDSISIDYYPGMWHMPLKAAGYHWKDTYKEMGMLKETCETISLWGKDYEIGESGFPTLAGFSEKRQRYFYDTFFRAFRQLMVDFKKRGVRLPNRVGLFETEDEPNTSFGGPVEKLLKAGGVRQLTDAVNPEHHWGLKKGEYSPKSILQGNRHKSNEDEEIVGLHLNDPKEASQLSKIIKYVNRSVANDE